MTFEIDRTGIIDFQSCPRKRYLSRHHLGTGIQRKSKGLPLIFGSAFHEGAELLLSGDVEGAVLKARDYLLRSFNDAVVVLDNEMPDDQAKNFEYATGEQMALAEALLRGWWLYEGQTFLETFEVLEVEKEGRARLAGHPSVSDYVSNEWIEGDGLPGPAYRRKYGVEPGNQPGSEIVLMFRPDALVRDRESGDLFVVSWKTCSTFGKRNVDQARHDMQSISEVFGVQQQFENAPYVEQPQSMRIEGVLYKWIVKGQRRKDNWDGLYKQGSHLVYGWKKLASAGDETDWSWAFEFPNEEDPNKTSKLGKGWKKVPVWLEYPGGVKQWIEDLASGTVFPRHENPLAKVFPQALPVERRADEVSRWKTQVTAQEMTVAKDVECVQQYGESVLDGLFPMHTARCHDYGSDCAFIDVCHNGVPAEPGDLYQIRIPNHPENKGGEDE